MSTGTLVIDVTTNSSNAVSGLKNVQKSLKELDGEYKIMSDGAAKATLNVKKFQDSLDRTSLGSGGRKFGTPQISQLDDFIVKAMNKSEQIARIKDNVQSDLDFFDGQSSRGGRGRGGGGGVGSMKGVGKQNSAVQGLLELSRGLEDAAVSFGTGGISGAIRGATNNISQFAMITGGPAAGAIAGFAAAAVSMAVPALDALISKMMKSEEAARHLKTAMDGMETNKWLSKISGERSFGRSLNAVGKSADEIKDMMAENALGIRDDEDDLEFAKTQARKLRNAKALDLEGIDQKVYDAKILEADETVANLERRLQQRRTAQEDYGPRMDRALVKEGTLEAIKAAKEIDDPIIASHMKWRENFLGGKNKKESDDEDALIASHMKWREGFLGGENKQDARKAESFASKIRSDLMSPVDQSLSAAFSGTAAANSIAAQASRIQGSEPTQEQIAKAVDAALIEHQKQTTLQQGIETTLKEQVKLRGVKLNL